MGADQTRVCKDNQENTTLKNVQSIDDYSPRGLSLQRKANVANNTGIPNNLKNGVETLSGYSLNDVRVHYNSSKPAAVQAYAYTQGTDIHIAPGQESCLPHEAWHVTQQMSGRVSPTTSIGGVAVNDDASLEHEADVMGARASTLQGYSYAPVSRKALPSSVRQNKMTSAIVQRESRKSNRRVELSDDEACIKSFADNVYEEDDYKAGKHGHFKAKYTPGNRRLHVTLPVYFEKNMNELDVAGRKTRKQYFIDNVENTWSNKHLFDFRPSRLRRPTQPSSNITWLNVLNNTNVKVTVEEKLFSSDSFFPFGNSFFNLKAVQGDSSVGKENVKLRKNSFVGGKSDGGLSLNPTAHEAGHMFGLGDEYRVKNRSATYRTSTGKEKKYYYYTIFDYPGFKLRAVDNTQRLQTYDLSSERTIQHNGKTYNVGSTLIGLMFVYYLEDASSHVRLNRALDGTVSTHYDMVKDFFDENHANNHAVMHDNTASAKNRISTSIMRNGDTVEAHHYVTFADAMVQAIQNEYPEVPSPVAPNTRDDWTIK